MFFVVQTDSFVVEKVILLKERLSHTSWVSDDSFLFNTDQSLAVFLCQGDCLDEFRPSESDVLGELTRETREVFEGDSVTKSKFRVFLECKF